VTKTVICLLTNVKSSIVSSKWKTSEEVMFVQTEDYYTVSTDSNVLNVVELVLKFGLWSTIICSSMILTMMDMLTQMILVWILLNILNSILPVIKMMMDLLINMKSSNVIELLKMIGEEITVHKDILCSIVQFHHQNHVLVL
jgi:hypothetical protein